MVLQAGNLALLGGQLCLDFTNTLQRRDADQPHDFLASYSDLVSWSQHADILTPEEADQLLEQAAARQAEAGAVLQHSLVLRETMYRLFSAIVHGQSPDSTDMERLNAVLPGSLARRRIIARSESFAWDWIRSDQALDCMLWPVVESAADLLTAGELHRLRQCAGCGWLFLDRSRNGSRRWCDMRVCGNRAKARRYYERQQRQST